MYRVMAIYRDAPADPAAFRAHYETVHMPLCGRLPGIRSSTYSFDIGSPDGSTSWFAMWQGTFDDKDAVGAALASPEGAAMLADLANYDSKGMLLLQSQDS